VAGGGRLVLAEGTNLVAFESVLKPRPGELDYGLDRYEVRAPGHVGFVAGLHPGLRGQISAIDLQLDPHPYGRFRRAARGRVASDGTTYFGRRLTRNTRIRVVAAGGPARSPVGTVVAYPRFGLRFGAVSRTRGFARVRLSGGPDFRVGGRRVFLYHGSARRRRHERLGSALLRQVGRGIAVARIEYTYPRAVSRRDVSTYCIPRMPALGYGTNDPFQRRCGRRIIPY
jgi:hypothetical protein